MNVAIVAIMLALLALNGCGQRTPPARNRSPAGTADSARPQADSVIVALGNEPFWNVRVSGDEIRYRDPEHQDGFRFPPAAAVREGDTLVFRTRRELPAGDPGPRILELRIRTEACSDGMSDRKYSLKARLQIGEETRTGCAYRESP